MSFIMMALMNIGKRLQWKPHNEMRSCNVKRDPKGCRLITKQMQCGMVDLASHNYHAQCAFQTIHSHP